MSAHGTSSELAIQDPDDMRYPGSKGLAGVYHWICDRLADHMFYAEPFVGKGAVYRNKVPALRSTLIDRDPAIVDWWRSRIDRDGDGRGHRQGRRVRPSHVEVIHGCGIEWMERQAKRAPLDLLVYCDPPYLPITRVRQDLYRFEMTVKDHIRFLVAATRLPCPVMVSGYMSDLYCRYLADWRLDTRVVVTRGGSLRTECLWTNAPAAQASAVAMHYRELGPDFRSRERVARKVKRWAANFGRLPAAERRAIILALLNEERDACSNNSLIQSLDPRKEAQ